MKLLVIFLLFPFSLCAQISKEDIAATVAHRNQLIQQLQTEHDAALASQADTTAQLIAEQTAHHEADKALSANVAVNADLQRQIKAQDSEISSLKWSRWKYAIISVLISVPLGILLAIGSFLAVKAGWAGAKASAWVAIQAAKV